jgi:hypothetical protein
VSADVRESECRFDTHQLTVDFIATTAAQVRWIVIGYPHDTPPEPSPIAAKPNEWSSIVGTHGLVRSDDGTPVLVINTQPFSTYLVPIVPGRDAVRGVHMESTNGRIVGILSDDVSLNGAPILAALGLTANAFYRSGFDIARDATVDGVAITSLEYGAKQTVQAGTMTPPCPVARSTPDAPMNPDILGALKSE